MNDDHLVRMCNQIGTFFETMPDREKAIQDLANHLKNFWAPSMRHQLLMQIEQGEADDLSAISLDALRKYQERLR